LLRAGDTRCDDYVWRHERRSLMLQEPDAGREDIPRRGTVLIDAMLYNGVDGLAMRRAHMRELTRARQAAERRYTQPALAANREGPPRLTTARERTEEYQAEIARISAEHRIWMHEQGEIVVELRTRRRKAAAAAEL
jgi:hypothetical protein